MVARSEPKGVGNPQGKLNVCEIRQLHEVIEAENPGRRVLDL